VDIKLIYKKIITSLKLRKIIYLSMKNFVLIIALSILSVSCEKKLKNEFLEIAKRENAYLNHYNRSYYNGLLNSKKESNPDVLKIIKIYSSIYEKLDFIIYTLNRDLNDENSIKMIEEAISLSDILLKYSIEVVDIEFSYHKGVLPKIKEYALRKEIYDFERILLEYKINLFIRDIFKRDCLILKRCYYCGKL